VQFFIVICKNKATKYLIFCELYCCFYLFQRSISKAKTEKYWEILHGAAMTEKLPKTGNFGRFVGVGGRVVSYNEQNTAEMMKKSQKIFMIIPLTY